MSDVEFDTDKGFDLKPNFDRKNRSSPASFLLRIGLAKNENVANMILLVLAVLIFALAFFFFSMNKAPKNDINNKIEVKPYESVGYPQYKLK